jgi:hypothetical protein
MMSGVPLETCWAFNKLWNNKFYYKTASCSYFYWVIYDARIHEYHIFIRNFSSLSFHIYIYIYMSYKWVYPLIISHWYLACISPFTHTFHKFKHITADLIGVIIFEEEHGLRSTTWTVIALVCAELRYRRSLAVNSHVLEGQIRNPAHLCQSIIRHTFASL